MDGGDIAAAFASAIALAALIVSLLNRRGDIEREEQYRIRTRVWELLNGEPGLRTVQALDESDGKTNTRIKLLRRTAVQLKAAGAESLGRNLETVLDGSWPDPGEELLSARATFVDCVTKFMNPA